MAVENITPLADNAIPSITTPIDLSTNNEEFVIKKPTTTLKSKTNVSRAMLYLMVVGALMAIILGIILFNKNRQSKIAETATDKAPPAFSIKNKEVNTDSLAKIKDDILKDEARKAQEAIDAKAAEDAKKPTYSNNVAVTTPQTNTAPTNTDNKTSKLQAQAKPETPFARKMKGDVLFDFLGTTNSVTGDKFNISNPSSNNVLPITQSTDNAISAQLHSTKLQNYKATRLDNLDYLLKRGTIIPCALKTGIDTTLAGFVTCDVVNDVYSANGHTLLVERGASVFGEEQSSLKQGQARVFVLWTRLDNSDGVTTELDSPATDQMGFNGINGFVDTHFWERFGGAIMISFIKDFSASINKPNTSNNSGTLSLNNTTNSSTDLATETLRNSINIPPTLVVNPATVVNVLLARDVSFENVYSVQH